MWSEEKRSRDGDQGANQTRQKAVRSGSVSSGLLRATIDVLDVILPVLRDDNMIPGACLSCPSEGDAIAG